MNGSGPPMIEAAYLRARSPVTHEKTKCVNTVPFEHGSMLEYHRIHLSIFFSNGGEAFRALLRYSWRLRLNIYRSSRREVFCKKGVLRNFTKFTGKHLFQSLFFNKVAGLRPPFYIEHLWWLLLYLLIWGITFKLIFWV